MDPIEKHMVGLGSMNLDVADILMKPEDSRLLENGRRIMSGDGKSGLVRNILGNTLIDLIPGLSTTARAIGSVYYPKNQSVIWFISDDDNSGIFEYIPSSKKINKILQPGNALLNFTPYSIIHGFVINGMLIWNDSENPIRKINIEKAKYYTDGDTVNGYAVMDSKTISYYKTPPTEIIKPYYTTDNSRAINNVRGILFQFRYSYIFDDGEESRASIISKVVLPDGELHYSGEVDGPLNQNNCLVLGINTGHSTVTKIKLFVRSGNSGDWSHFETLDKEELELSDYESYKYYFYNDSIIDIVDQTKINTLYDAIPPKVDRISFLHTNQMGLAGLTEGYENVSGFDVSLTPSVSEQEAITRGDLIHNYEPVLVPGFNSTYYFSFPDKDLPAEGMSVVITIQGVSQTFIASYLDSTNVNEFIANVTTIVKEAYKGYTVAKVRNALTGAYGIEVWFMGVGTFTMSITTYLTKGDPYKVYSAFKSGATHTLGVVYYDENMRNGYVNKIPDIYLPFITEANFPISSPSVKKQGDRYALNWSILHRPPSWATKFSFVYGQNKEILNFRQYIMGEVKTSGAATNPPPKGLMSINISYLNQLQDQFNGFDFSFPNSSIEPYTFQKGDRIRFITKSKTNFDSSNGGSPGLGDLLDFYLDVEILDYQVNAPDANGAETPTNNILISEFDTSKYPNIGENTLVEIYTPKKEIGEIVYFEIGEFFDIIDPGTSSRRHGGATQDQVFDNNGNCTSPAQGILSDGDIYFVPTVFSKNLETNISQVPFSNIESKSASNFYSQDIHNYGRINIINRNAQQKWYPILRLSDKYFENTNYNGLSTVGTDTEVSVSNQDGKIFGLEEAGYVLKIIQERKLTSFYVGKTGLQLVSGKELQAENPGALGTKNPSVSNFGTQNPESVFKFENKIFFFDIIQKAIVEADYNGLTDISIGINSDIQMICEKLITHDHYGVLTSFNPKTKDVMFTFWGLNGNLSDENYFSYGTYIFNLPTRKWDARFDYTEKGGKPVELFANTGNSYMAFNRGKIWEQETNSKYNNFFGDQKPLKITLIFNQPFDIVKLYKILEVYGIGTWASPNDGDIKIAAEHSQSGKEQISRLKNGRFKKMDAKLYADFLKDLNTFQNSPLLSLHNGKDLKGQVLSLTLENNDSTAANLAEVSIIYQPLQIT